MIDYETYKSEVLFLLYDWVIKNPEPGPVPEDTSQFLENPVINQHQITDGEIYNSYTTAVTFCTERTMRNVNDIPSLALVYKGASILWLRCNKYVDTRDETGNYIVSYGDYLMKECLNLLKHYMPSRWCGLRGCGSDE